MKKVSFLKMFAIMAAFAFMGLMTVSCQKDNITPDTPDVPEEPADPNYFIFGDDSVQITSVTREYSSTYSYHYTTLNLSNGNTFTLVSIFEPNTTYDIITYNDLFYHMDCIAGGYTMESGNIFLSEGTFNANYHFGHADIDFNGKTDGGIEVRGHFSGNVTDISETLGDGSFSYFGDYTSLNLFYGFVKGGMGEFLLTSTDMNTRIKLNTKGSLVPGIYNITTDEQAIAGGHGMGMRMEVKNSKGEYTTTAVSGTVEYRINPNSSIQLTINGNTEDASFNGTYTGTVITLMLM